MENFDPNKTPKKQILSAQIDLSKFERATDEEKRQQDVMSESTSFFKDGMRKLFKNPLAVASIIVLVAIIITIIVAPMIVPYGYEEILSVNGKRDKGAKNLAPFTYSKAEQKFIDEGGTRFPHIMGTDEQCRDYFIRVIYGHENFARRRLLREHHRADHRHDCRQRLGYAGGRVDLILMRIVDIIYSLPDMLVIILLATVLNQTLTFPAGSALGKARLKHGLDVHRLRTSLLGRYGAPYPRSDSLDQGKRVRACCALDRRKARLDHPQAHPAELSFGYHCLDGAADSVGNLHRELPELHCLGVNAPMPSLGSLANSARQGLQTYPYKLIFPTLMICLIVLSLNLLGDGLRDAFDPKLKR